MGLIGDECFRYKGFRAVFKKGEAGRRQVARGSSGCDRGQLRRRSRRWRLQAARRPREGGGKSGGFRTIILFRVGSHSFFAHGFAKNEKANVSPKELKALKRLADVLLGFSQAQLEAAQAAGQLVKVHNGGDVEEKD